MQSLSIDRKLSNLPLAITMGEPGGINSEIFLKAINEINKIDYFIICDPSWIEKSIKFFNKKISINILDQNLNTKENYINVMPTKRNVIFKLGKPNKRNNRAIIESIDKAVYLAKNNIR